MFFVEVAHAEPPPLSFAFAPEISPEAFGVNRYGARLGVGLRVAEPATVWLEHSEYPTHGWRDVSASERANEWSVIGLRSRVMRRTGLVGDLRLLRTAQDGVAVALHGRAGVGSLWIRDEVGDEAGTYGSPWIGYGGGPSVALGKWTIDVRLEQTLHLAHAYGGYAYLFPNLPVRRTWFSVGASWSWR